MPEYCRARACSAPEGGAEERRKRGFVIGGHASLFIFVVIFVLIFVESTTIRITIRLRPMGYAGTSRDND